MCISSPSKQVEERPGDKKHRGFKRIRERQLLPVTAAEDEPPQAI